MKISQIVKTTSLPYNYKNVVTEGLTWTELDHGLSVNERVSIMKHYFLSKHKNLVESNTPELREQFLNLVTMSDKPTKNSEFLIIFLALLNDNVLQMAKPRIGTVLSKQGNEYTVKFGNDITQYPSKTLMDQVVSITLFFKNAASFDVFRTFVELKFEFNMAEYDSYLSPNPKV